MAEGKKNIAQLRAEVRSMIASIQVAPSKMCRADLERMKEVYGAAAEKDKTLPPAEKRHGGRTKAKEVEGAEKDGIAIPKKLVKEKTQYAADKEKKAKATIKPGKLDDDSGSGSASEEDVKQTKKATKKVEKAAVEPTSAHAPEKKKRVISPEQLAKMKAGREAKKAGGDAKPKKDDAPPDAPAKKEKPTEKKETKDDESQYIKLPVFRLG
jgi:hypothetical protein